MGLVRGWFFTAEAQRTFAKDRSAPDTQRSKKIGSLRDKISLIGNRVGAIAAEIKNRFVDLEFDDVTEVDECTLVVALDEHRLFGKKNNGGVIHPCFGGQPQAD